jgi:hypothetical protein
LDAIIQKIQSFYRFYKVDLLVCLADYIFCNISICLCDVLGDPCERLFGFFINFGFKASELVCQVIYLGLLIKLSDEANQTSKVFQVIAHFTVKFAFHLPFSF